MAFLKRLFSKAPSLQIKITREGIESNESLFPVTAGDFIVLHSRGTTILEKTKIDGFDAKEPSIS